MCEDRRARMIIKSGAGKATVPATSDHRDGTWLATDVYPGEWYLDTDTGIVYTRNGSDIVMQDGTAKLVYKANISQTGTNAPVLTVIENTLGVITTEAYLGVGVYTIAGFAGNLVDPCEIIANLCTSGGTEQFNVVAADADTLLISTLASGAAADGVVDGVGTTITVIKY